MNANAILTRDTYQICNSGVLDLFGIWRLERACFPKDAYDLPTLLSLVLMPNTLRLKAVSAEMLVGFLAVEYQNFDHTGWIVTVGVSPGSEGRGIGRSLLTCAEQQQRKKVTQMKLTVRRSNERAIGLYKRCGYEWVGTYRGYYHDGEDGLIMAKNLTLL